MNEIFKLKSVYEMVLEFSTNTRPVRIEIFESMDHKNKFRARAWDQNTYNLYPTFANIEEKEGLINKYMSCDEINREITTILSGDDPGALIFGKEWESEEKFLSHIKGLLMEYQRSLNE